MKQTPNPSLNPIATLRLIFSLAKRINIMIIQNYDYCLGCGQQILNVWKGWPHKDSIPLLPRIIDGSCEKCGGAEVLKTSTICWLNYHSEYSTGLPDYWLLITQSQKNKWGLPYFGEANCPKCNNRAILSQMKYPNGSTEICYNCEKCGVAKAKNL